MRRFCELIRTAAGARADGGGRVIAGAKPLVGIEHRLAECRKALTVLEHELAEPALYSEPGRKDALTALLRQRAEVSSRIDSLETSWLETSEELERHKTGLARDG